MGKKIYLTIIWVITLICILFGIWLNIFGGGSLFSLAGGGNWQDVTLTDTDTISSIDINADVMGVEIKTGDAWKIQYNYSSIYNEPTFEVNADGVLTITQTQEDNITTPLGNKHCKVEITVPDSVSLTSTNASIALGDLEVEEVPLGDLAITMDCGNVELDDLSLGNVSGELSLGNFELTHCSVESVNLVCDMGNAELELADDVSNYAMNLTCDLGHVEVENDTVSANYTQDGTAGTISIECNLGNIEVETAE